MLPHPSYERKTESLEKRFQNVRMLIDEGGRIIDFVMHDEVEILEKRQSVELRKPGGEYFRTHLLPTMRRHVLEGELLGL